MRRSNHLSNEMMKVSVIKKIQRIQYYDDVGSANDQDSAPSSRPSRDFNSSVPYLLNFSSTCFGSADSQTSPHATQSRDSAVIAGDSSRIQAGAISFGEKMVDGVLPNPFS